MSRLDVFHIPHLAKDLAQKKETHLAQHRTTYKNNKSCYLSIYLFKPFSIYLSIKRRAVSIVARARTTLEFNTRRPAQFRQLYESPPAVTWLTVYRWIEVYASGRPPASAAVILRTSGTPSTR